MTNNTLIVAHGDFDGIASAVLLAERLGISAEDVQVVFTQPFLVDKVEIPDDIKEVYVVDIAVNNRDPEMTKTFIESLGARLKEWCDHHQGWSESEMDDRFVIHSTAPACAVILGSGMPPRLHHLQQIVNDAIATDTRKGEVSATGTLIEHACKADIRNDATRVAAVKWLLGDRSQLLLLQEAAKKYATIQKETERLAGKYRLISSDEMNTDSNRIAYDPDDFVETQVVFVDTTDIPVENLDLTQLLLAGQEIAEFAMATHTDSRSGESMVTVATRRKDVNLVETFGLPSGAPFRVTLPIARLEEVKKTIRGLPSLSIN